jgi:hypothetical protein
MNPHAEDFQLDTAIHGMTDEHLQCRDFSHSWRPLIAAWGLTQSAVHLEVCSLLGVIDGCRSGIRAINRPIAPREDLDGTTVGGVRAGRTAHEGKLAFCGWKSARTARQGRCGRLRFAIRPVSSRRPWPALRWPRTRGVGRASCSPSGGEVDPP